MLRTPVGEDSILPPGGVPECLVEWQTEPHAVRFPVLCNTPPNYSFRMDVGKLPV